MNREMVFYNQRMIDKTLNKEEMKALNTRSLLNPLEPEPEPEPDQDPHYPTNNVKTPILTPNLLLFPFTHCHIHSSVSLTSHSAFRTRYHRCEAACTPTRWRS